MPIGIFLCIEMQGKEKLRASAISVVKNEIVVKCATSHPDVF